MSFNFRFSTWTLPHFATALLTAAGGAALSYVETAVVQGGIPTTASAVEALAKGAGVAALAVVLGLAKTMLAPNAQAASNALAKAQSK
jgi:hypothetical protein